MTKQEVIVKAIEGRITWIQAADILGYSARHMLRVKLRYEEHGYGGLRDGRAGVIRRKRIAPETIRRLCELKRDRYPDFTVQHFHEFAVERHGFKLGYTWTLKVLQAAGLAEKSAARGKYRRKRERRSMAGMLLHLDASTHTWLTGLPQQDLVVMLDDADGRILFARFFPQEGTASTFAALRHVLVVFGRFCELYTDRGSHFSPTQKGLDGEVLEGQVSRALKTLGIRQILARSPQARGRSERAFGTIQGRLPQELRAAGIRDYQAANGYLDTHFNPDFNRRFTVVPAQKEKAFMPVRTAELELLLSVQHERVVRNDSTVSFERLMLQLPPTRDREHYVRCPVLVHELPNETLAVSHQGRLLARFDRQGGLLPGRPQPTHSLQVSPRAPLEQPSPQTPRRANQAANS
jgi:hypothetical protein